MQQGFPEQFGKPFIFCKKGGAPGGLELPTFWFVAVAARRISNLHQWWGTATQRYKCSGNSGLGTFAREPVALPQVWWWSQIWAQRSCP